MGEQRQLDKLMYDLLEVIRFTGDVATKICGLRSDTELFRAVKAEFAKSKRYNITFFMLTDDGSNLRIGETSYTPKLVKTVEKAAGVGVKDYRLDLSKAKFFRKFINEGETIYVNSIDVISEIVPSSLASLISKTLGFGNYAILAPLKRHENIIGFFVRSSPEMVEHFLPSVRTLAAHISAALTMAYETAERERVEKVHDESAQRFKSLVEDVAAPICTINLKGKFTYVNPAFSELVGYSASELLSRNFKDFLHPKDRGARVAVVLQHYVVAEKAAALGFPGDR